MRVTKWRIRAKVSLFFFANVLFPSAREHLFVIFNKASFHCLYFGLPSCQAQNHNYSIELSRDRVLTSSLTPMERSPLGPLHGLLLDFPAKGDKQKLGNALESQSMGSS